MTVSVYFLKASFTHSIMAEELTAMFAAAATKVAADPALWGRIVALLHAYPRTPKLVASVFGHVVICGIIGTCFPGANRFDSFIPMDGSIFSSFSYPDRMAWTMHTLVTDDCVSFICNTIGTAKSYTIRFPRANLFKNEDFSNVAACFHDKATLALSTMLTGFALCDVGGDFTINYNN
jgi:hypothetical protein